MILWSSPSACKVEYELYFSSVVNLAQVTSDYDAGATVSVWGQGPNGSDRIQLGANSCYASNGGSINTCTVPTGHSSGTTFYVVIDSKHTTWNWMGNFVATTSPPSPSSPPSSPPVLTRVCTYTFKSKASLKTAVNGHNGNPSAATIEKYGPIADWCVSTIIDMSDLFRNLREFNWDISNWDTSRVTTMSGMFAVRSARALAPSLQSAPARVHATSTAAATRPVAFQPAPRPASYALLSTRQGASKFNQPVSFPTSSVTNIRGMFAVRSARALCGFRPSIGHSQCIPLAPPPPHALPQLAPHCINSFRLGRARVSLTS